ncbi:MAG: TetR/AcrR family transcriptional regulator [Bacteroidales bacterium]
MDVKDRIIEEAGILFGKYGIRTMTMDALAEEMGISKRTIYERFKDKDTLLMEVLQTYQEKVRKQAEDLIDQSENSIEALFRIIEMTVTQMSQVNPNFHHDFKKYHYKVFKELSKDHGLRDLSITRKLFERGIGQGVFRNDIHLDIVNRTMHYLFELFGHESQLLDEGYDRRDLFLFIIVPFFRGISTTKGQTILEESIEKFSQKHNAK